MPEWLVTLLRIAVVLEICVVNLNSTHCCIQRKYSKRFVLFMLALSTVVIVGGGMLLLQLLPFYGNGNGIFVLFGFFYLIPLRLLYKTNMKQLLIVICSAWVYTLCTFSLCVQIAEYFGEEWFVLAAFVLQTVIFASTAFLFWRFIRYLFGFVFQNLDESTQRTLQLVSLSWFLTILFVHVGFVLGDNDKIFNILTMLLLMWCAGYTFYLVYRIVRATGRVKKLSTAVFRDTLTGIPNRNSFEEDFRRELADGDLSVMFMDLDDFKNVNDRFGHLAGDTYLKKFAQTTAEAVSRYGGSLYRLGGDEFAVLCRADCTDEIGEGVRDANAAADYEPAFLGVCIGSLRVERDGTPWDLQEILDRTDRLMYAEKRRKHEEN